MTNLVRLSAHVDPLGGISVLTGARRRLWAWVTVQHNNPVDLCDLILWDCRDLTVPAVPAGQPQGRPSAQPRP